MVIGAGAIGLLAAMALRARGLEVWLWSREPRDSPQARLVEAVGGRYRNTAERPLSALAAEVGFIALIFEATGAAPIAFEAMPLLGELGILPHWRARSEGTAPDRGRRDHEVTRAQEPGRLRERQRRARLVPRGRRGPDDVRTALAARDSPASSSRHDLDEVPVLLGQPPVGTKSVVRVAS